MKKKVYILLVNWNGWGDTIECLESIFRCDYQYFRVIVSDNGSTDGSLEHLCAWAEGKLDALVRNPALRDFSSPPCTKPVNFIVYDRVVAERIGGGGDDPSLVLIRNDRNLGFAGGNNVGLRYILGRNDSFYIWLLNNDTVIRPDTLRQLVVRMEERPDAGMCGATLLYYEHPQRVQALGGGYYCQWIGLPWHQGRLKRVTDPICPERAERWMNYVVGASMLITRQFVEEIGLMCEDYFLYFEEMDWAIRARNKFSLAYAPAAILYHKIGGSIGTSSNPREKSRTCDYFSIRNRLFFTRRYYPLALPFVVAVLVGSLTVRALLGQGDRVRLIWKLLLDMGRMPLEELRLRLPL